MTPPRLSRNESLVLGALREEKGAPQTAYQILETLRPEGLKAPLQVYRALKTLSERHLVHRLESLNAFVACSCGHEEGEEPALIFAICDECGTVQEWQDGGVFDHVGRIAAPNGFAPRFAATEVRGRCAVCRAGGETVAAAR